MPLPFTRGTISALAYGLFGGKGVVTASYLVVAGGGGGGTDNGGGGGAGGYLEASSVSLNPTLSYTVTVGAGGAGGASPSGGRGTAGSDSVFSTSTANGGGGGGGPATSSGVGGNGGSGGGGDGFNAAAGGTATQGNSGGATGYGNNGGTGASGGAGRRWAGGGGGATAAGSNGGAQGSQGGNGGAGRASSISGSSVTYAGGGGGGSRDSNSTGGSGGGGAGGGGGVAGTAGTANTGGGGGGGGDNAAGAQGGSGIVIISYPGAQQFGGGVVTSSGGNTIHTFTTSGTLSPLASLSASYLVVAGGGGGGYFIGGGGGAGGYLSGSSLTIDTNSVYVVTVGAGGAGGTSTTKGGTGNNSSIFSVTSSGGGGGGSYITPPGEVGANGGSGGGGAGYPGGAAGGTGTAGQGNNGGAGTYPSTNLHRSGGGGGASAAGQSGNGVAGNGGAGSASSISGSSVTYAGGGGGGYYGTSGANGSGGAGGGGAGGNPPTAGTANLGGGGGGAGGSGGGGDGGQGGSGIVIISYPGSAAQMAGGTITVAGGNVIHTFTSSGFLTPITNLTNSLRFRSSASAYLNRTPTVASNRTTWTWSGWVKRGTLGASGALFSAPNGTSDTTWFDLLFDTNNKLNVAGYTTFWRVTTQVFRDPSAWYHIVLAVDTTQATANNRISLYVNGTQITAFDTTNNMAQNANTGINAAAIHYVGRSSASYFDGYLEEINFIDGQALTPNAFGTLNDLGVWQPIRYGGSYGTNGFYLPFNQGGSTYAGSFNGTSQLISAPANAAFNFAGNFTAECWVNTSTITNASQPTLFTIGSDASGLVVGFFSGTFYCYMAGSGGLMTAATLPLNQWVHVAWVRVGSTNTLYINGISKATATNSSTLSSTGGVTVGRTGSSGTALNYFQGSVSNFRIVNSAVYTANFVPPTSALTAISGTQLLTLQNASIVDNSTNGFTITNTGSVTTSTNSIVFANTTSLCADQGPQGNNWTPNNISNTTGSTYDSMTDVPTNTSATVANYCVLNPLVASTNGSTVYNANLTILTVSSGNPTTTATFGVSSGKWYWEQIMTTDASSAGGFAGIVSSTSSLSTYVGSTTQGWGYYNSGNKYNNSTPTGYGASWTVNDVIGVALDMDAGTITFYKNNVSQGTAFTGLSGTMFPAVSDGGTGSITVNFNFGQQPFVYTPPSGFVALNTFNLPTPTIGATAATQAGKYFNTVLYTGNSGTLNVTGVGFQPDFVWTKSRSNGSTNHLLSDAVRGTPLSLFSNLTNAELTRGVTAFQSDGFQYIYPNEGGDGNLSPQTYVAWNWKANGAGSTNTAGTITSTVSANTTAGFSIVTYTGNATNGATVGHGLGVAPAMVIVKDRVNAYNWTVYHKNLSTADAVLILNSSSAQIASSAQFNSTAPSSTVITLGWPGSDNNTNATTAHVAYCFAEVAGYSQFGSYTGNGSADGPFIFTGFRPKYVLIKRIDSTGNWTLDDSVRSPYNVETVTAPFLYPNLNIAESNGNIDILSNGFKIRYTDSDYNTNGATYIYAAFAEEPFKYANAR